MKHPVQELTERLQSEFGWKHHKNSESCGIYGHGSGGEHWCKGGEDYLYVLPNYGEWVMIVKEAIKLLREEGLVK